MNIRGFALPVALFVIFMSTQGSSAIGQELEDPIRVVCSDTGIREIAEAWKSNYNSGNATAVANLYTEDGYYLSAHILAHGRTEIQAYWERGIAAGGHLEFIKPLIVSCSGDLGYSAGVYQATNAGVTVDGRILLVMTKKDGKWLIAAHETVVRDQP